MPAEALRHRYVQILLDGLADARYPSAPMLDRIESALDDRKAAEQYVEHLLDTVERDRYPSPTMLERVNRLIGQLEAL